MVILNSSYYFQLRGGGIDLIAMYSKIPYEVIVQVEWYQVRGYKFNSWSHKRQIFRNISYGLPSGIPID